MENGDNKLPFCWCCAGVNVAVSEGSGAPR